MAVTDRKHFRMSLTAATAGLLAGTAATTKAEELYNDWKVELGYLRYQEADRVSVDSYIADLGGNLSNSDNIQVGIVYDTMTGSTPTGAIPGEDSVTITGVSGGSVSAGTSNGALAPFDDTRLALDSTWTHEFKRQIRTNVGVYTSVESDYTAIGGSLGGEYDTASRNTTFSLALGFASDEISRTGEETPEPLADIKDAEMYGPGRKNTFDGLIGFSKVLNKYTIAQMNYSFSRSVGYHTDPYKVVSVADEEDNFYKNIYEKRPAERTRHILYSKINHELPQSGNHLMASYRYYLDDWGIRSHTLESSYAFNVKSDAFVMQPFVRLYYQNAADFYQRTIEYDETIDGKYYVEPDYVSADLRLAEMFAYTIGAKMSYQTQKYGTVSLRVGYMDQSFYNAVFDENKALFVSISFGQDFE
ncbi:DUF3570 domain-containing protein [Gynuella sunshinyii]|uniref:DUF3570 domain-containing protein n=1 Tax=Gynuella sunshinyii YC6258 TaxID=1445510 RepID=A0A0C5VLN0_9GAMM|nr:DUF3570 domain-containing protein [Gynuella sunshinyii]AJQ95196.1 hypothetical Protein YC6258_03160 [Gynuella sunshinyii YC6258]